MFVRIQLLLRQDININKLCEAELAVVNYKWL